MRWAGTIALLGLCVGCDSPQAEEAHSAPLAAAESRGGAAVEEQGAAPDSRRSGQDTSEAVKPAREVEVPVLAPDALRPGISREQLINSLGACGDRVKFLPARSNRRTLEVFQPKDAPCAERFGRRHFVVVADFVDRIEPGLREKDIPADGRAVGEKPDFSQVGDRTPE